MLSDPCLYSLLFEATILCVKQAIFFDQFCSLFDKTPVYCIFKNVCESRMQCGTTVVMVEKL